MKIPSGLSSRRNLIIILFLVFLFLRLFVNSSDILLGADHVKYLIMAKNFPYHTSANNQMEINHGPVYPYVIHFFTLVFKQDYISSIIILLFPPSFPFFFLYNLFMILSETFFFPFPPLFLRIYSPP